MNFICGIIGCKESAEYYGDEIYLCDAHAFEAGYLEEDQIEVPYSPEEIDQDNILVEYDEDTYGDEREFSIPLGFPENVV